VVIVGVLAGRLGGPRALRVAAVLAAVYPPLVWIAAYVYSEALFWPIGLAVVGSSIARRRRATVP
jgi:uncharacterized protein involved in response to NO